MSFSNFSPAIEIKTVVPAFGSWTLSNHFMAVEITVPPMDGTATWFGSEAPTEYLECKEFLNELKVGQTLGCKVTNSKGKYVVRWKKTADNEFKVDAVH